MRFFARVVFCGWLLTLSIGVTKSAWAHPELIRHGYANCNACHVSPSGGGLLNSYGRSLSQALLSTWGTEEEAAPFYGALHWPESLHAQAFIRGVQFIKDTPRYRSGQLLIMQTDLEISGNYGKVSGIAAFGLEHISPRHYLLLQLGEQSTLRAGKFRTDYGLNLANHSAATRQGLGWGPGSETYNIEWGIQGDLFTGALTAVLGKLDSDSTSERGIALSGSTLISERFKIGASFFHGVKPGSSRTLAGPFAILGFTPRFYFLTELDFKFTDENFGYVSYHRIGYDLIQGVQPYLIAETDVSDFKDKATETSGWGIGMMWNPRPHLEFQLEAKLRQNHPSIGNEALGFFVFSFYL